MMTTGPVTALPLCVPAKAHLRPPSACQATSSAPLHVRVSSLPTRGTHGTACKTAKSAKAPLPENTVFTWQQRCRGVHKIFIRAVVPSSCVDVINTHRRPARLTFTCAKKPQTKAQFCVNYESCLGSNKIDKRGNGFQLQQWGGG